MSTPPRFLQYIKKALHQRMELIYSCHAEDTDCYRLFHGATEMWPSVVMDRYGSSLIVQTWREELSDKVVAQMGELVEETLGEEFDVLWCDRSQRGQVQRHVIGEPPPEVMVGHELGIQYRVDPVHRGIDPLLFLDFRAGRRRILAESQNKTVLNLFSYTCGIGAAACKGGAKKVINVDFAQHALSIGRANAQLNGFDKEQFQTVKEDAIAVVRQYSGLGIKGRAKNHPHTKLSAHLFDIVVLDPPRFAKSPFGVVDTVNDYASLFKPALLCVKANGKMLVTNNVASVDQEQWVASLQRCIHKNGREIQDIHMIAPESDFPSIDGVHPLKMAWIHLL